MNKQSNITKVLELPFASGYTQLVAQPLNLDTSVECKVVDTPLDTDKLDSGLSEQEHIEGIIEAGHILSRAGFNLRVRVFTALDDGVDADLIRMEWVNSGQNIGTIDTYISGWRSDKGVADSRRGRKVENPDEVGALLEYVQARAQADVNEMGLTLSEAGTKWTAICRAAAPKIKKLKLTPASE
jgi:hypothetical protein